MLFISLSNEIFIFKNMNISQIFDKICDFIDRGILCINDLENFITKVYFLEKPSTFIELCTHLEK